MIYKKLNFKLHKCPGDICEVWQKPKRVNSIIIILVIAGFFAASYYGLKLTKYVPSKDDIAFQKELKEDNAFISGKDKDKDCTPPQLAIDIGHKELWLEHHGCK